ncbi:MAG: TRAM domain-containing protein [Firmicutes bacterium]|nr:TRAM domain-containing protein [Bacillota bacterium]
MPDTPSRTLSPGAEVELEVNDLNSEGQGVARWRGLAVFVEGGLPGERVAARVLRSGRSYARAEAVGILRPSPDRVTPPCPVFGSCGGCQLQALSYRAQLEWKTHLVRETLRRVGGLDGVPVEPCLAAPAPLGYRNKAQFPVTASGSGRRLGRRTGPGAGRGLTAGLYRRGTHDLIPVEECLLQHPLNNRVISETVRLARESGVPAYDEDTGQGLLQNPSIQCPSFSLLVRR